MNTDLISFFFFENRAIYRIMWKNILEPGRLFDKMALEHFMLKK